MMAQVYSASAVCQATSHFLDTASAKSVCLVKVIVDIVSLGAMEEITCKPLLPLCAGAGTHAH